MKVKLTCIGLITVAALVALVAHAGNDAKQAGVVDPDTVRVFWPSKERRSPAFVSQALIGDLDLTSQETVDLSHTPLEASQASTLKFFLFHDPNTLDDCLPFPTPARIAGSGKTYTPIERIKRGNFAAIGTVSKVVPGWETGLAMPANMVFLDVREILKDLDQLAIPGQTVAFLQISGAELEISGKRLCSADIGDPKPTVGEDYVLFGYIGEVEPDVVSGRAFAIDGETIYPNPQMRGLKSAEPLSVWDLRAAFATSSQAIGQ